MYVQSHDRATIYGFLGIVVAVDVSCPHGRCLEEAIRDARTPLCHPEALRSAALFHHSYTSHLNTIRCLGIAPDRNQNLVFESIGPTRISHFERAVQYAHCQ